MNAKTPREITITHDNMTILVPNLSMSVDVVSTCKQIYLYVLLTFYGCNQWKETIMAIPSINDLMLPILELMGDGKPHHQDEAIAMAAERFNMSEEDLAQRHEKSNRTVISNQIDWVRSYFSRAKIGQKLDIGWFQITPCGQYVLKHHAAELSVKFVLNFTCPDAD